MAMGVVESIGMVSRRWMWVESMGVCGYIDYLILLIPTPLVAVLLQQCPNGIATQLQDNIGV